MTNNNSADVLSEVFGFGDMEYFAGMKLFNRVIDRLRVDMDQQKRYEVYDRIYEEGMREKVGAFFFRINLLKSDV